MTIGLEQERQSQSAVLAEQLRSLILDGKFSTQKPLPSQRRLSEHYQTGVQVVRSALAILEKEGMVTSRPRQGTFVRLHHGDAQEAAAASGLSSITFVERTRGTTPAFVRTDYLQGYTEVLETLATQVRFVRCPEADPDWAELLSPSEAYEAQGLVLINLVSPALMEWLVAHQVPFVLQKNKAYEHASLPPHHSIYINKMHSGFEATRHLLELGHRRIAFIGEIPVHDGLAIHDLCGGYRAALAWGGLRPRPEDLLELSTNEVAMAAGAVHEFLDRHDRPAAIVAQNDAIALAVLQASRELGLQVPQDLSVVGFDDIPEAAHSDPPLTTFAQPRVRLGRSALELLLEVSAGQHNEPQTRVLEGYMIVRKTTGPPPS